MSVGRSIGRLGDTICFAEVRCLRLFTSIKFLYCVFLLPRSISECASSGYYVFHRLLMEFCKKCVLLKMLWRFACVCVCVLIHNRTNSHTTETF